MRPAILIAIGGGGATHGSHPELDRFCLEQVVPRPRVGFVGAASGDDPEKLRRFTEAFSPFARQITALPAGAGADRAANWVSGLDLVYVGGGHPGRLVALWRKNRVAEALAEASQRGTVLAGVSAGAMCWFEAYLWRAGDGTLQPEKGLGLIPGALTPHSLAEPERRTRMSDLVAAGVLPEGHAIDDGAALLLHDAVPVEPFPAAGPPFVHRITRP